MKISLRQLVKQWCLDNPGKSVRWCLQYFEQHNKRSVIKYYHQFKQVVWQSSVYSQIIEWRYKNPKAKLIDCLNVFRDENENTVIRYFNVSSPKDTHQYVIELRNKIRTWLQDNPNGTYEQCFNQIGIFGHYQYSDERFRLCWEMACGQD